MWCGVMAWPAGTEVESVGGGAERIRPEGLRDGSVEEDCTNAIVESAEDPFGTSVLLGGVWACEA